MTLPVAIKCLRPDVECGGKIEFLKEAAIMGQFYHRNVVTMLGVVVDSDPVSYTWNGCECLIQPLAQCRAMVSSSMLPFLLVS